MKQRLLCLFLLTFALSGFALASTPIDPRGIYLNEFSGGFSGSEWLQVTPIAGEPGRYRIADIHGGGFNATIEGTKITLDGGIGEGRFANEKDFTVMPKLGGEIFTFQARRAAFTGPNMVLSAQTAQPGDARLAGDWSSLTQTRNPVTGVISDGGTEALKITVNGSNMRITDPNGLYFQGVFISPQRVVFRAIEPGKASRAAYDTIPGSEINFAQDMVGEAVFDGPDKFSATFLLQSRTPLGKQSQRLITFEGQRAH